MEKVDEEYIPGKGSVHAQTQGGISFMCSGSTRRLAWWVRLASKDGRVPLCRKLRTSGRAKRHLGLTYIMTNSFLELWSKTGWGDESGNESRADAITAVPVG